MDIQLIHGQFEKTEALELMTQMIHVKVSFMKIRSGTHLMKKTLKWGSQELSSFKKIFMIFVNTSRPGQIYDLKLCCNPISEQEFL